MTKKAGAVDGRDPLAGSKDDRQFVTALARGLEVLRCFTPQRPSLGTTEIAALTGLPQPTVWRLCHTLETMGYLSPAPGSKFTPGIPLLTLGYAVVSSLDFLDIVRPHMQRLADEFGAAVALAERSRMSMVYLERCHGRSVFLLNLRAGARLPIHNSAAGWAYLAAAGEAERARLMAEIRHRSGQEWPAMRDHIEGAIRHHVSAGFVGNYSVQHPDVTAVAVPISVRDRILVVNCTGLRSVLNPDTMENRVGPALVDLGGTIAAALGATTRD